MGYHNDFSSVFLFSCSNFRWLNMSFCFWSIPFNIGALRWKMKASSRCCFEPSNICYQCYARHFTLKFNEFQWKRQWLQKERWKAWCNKIPWNKLLKTLTKACIQILLKKETTFIFGFCVFRQNANISNSILQSKKKFTNLDKNLY